MSAVAAGTAENRPGADIALVFSGLAFGLVLSLIGTLTVVAAARRVRQGGVRRGLGIVAAVLVSLLAAYASVADVASGVHFYNVRPDPCLLGDWVVVAHTVHDDELFSSTDGQLWTLVGPGPTVHFGTGGGGSYSPGGKPLRWQSEWEGHRYIRESTVGGNFSLDRARDGLIEVSFWGEEGREQETVDGGPPTAILEFATVSHPLVTGSYTCNATALRVSGTEGAAELRRS